MNRYRVTTLGAAVALSALLMLALSACGRQTASDPMAQILAGTAESARRETRPAETGAASGEADAPAKLESLKLSVLRVTDPRLPDFDDEAFAFFLKTLKVWAERASQRELVFDCRETVSAQRYFLEHKEVVQVPMDGKGPAILRFDIMGAEAVDCMRGCLAQCNVADLRKYFSDAPAELNSAEAWAAYLVADFRKKWASFRQPHPPHPALMVPDQDEFSRPEIWRALADHPDEQVDLIVTNAFIAGAERRMDLDRIQRGGMLTGLWSVNRKKNTLGLTMVISIQPVLVRSPFVIDVPDRARPAVAAIYTWRYLHALWMREPELVDPLSTAVGLVSGSQERR